MNFPKVHLVFLAASFFGWFALLTGICVYEGHNGAFLLYCRELVYIPNRVPGAGGATPAPRAGPSPGVQEFSDQASPNSPNCQQPLDP